MKILIGYDGSSCSDASLDDLCKAGLPENVEATVISIAEIWLSPPAKESSKSECVTAIQNRPLKFKVYERKAKAVTELETLANHARCRLRRNFPSWKVEAQADYGSPTDKILSRAAEINADLIIVGSHGRTALGRFFLGSISNKILTEAKCSVRIGRGKIEVDPIPSRVIIGYDGSRGANAAVEAVAARNWREGSEFRLITATEQVAPAAIERFVPPIADWVEDEIKTEREHAEKLAENALKILAEADLDASLIVRAGNPKQILVEEAERWHADSIFVGANRYGSRFEKFLLGSTSAAVAARATCSVEVVRNQSFGLQK